MALRTKSGNPVIKYSINQLNWSISLTNQSTNQSFTICQAISSKDHLVNQTNDKTTKIKQTNNQVLDQLTNG